MNKISRGLRNNNPGNIRLSNFIKWKGQSAKQTDKSFVQFDTMEDGYRAMAKTLLTYFNKHKLNTIRAIISRWAPSNENNTNAYISSVSRSMNLGADKAFRVDSEPMLVSLCAAISRVENGVPADMIALEKGVKMALG